MFGRSIKVVSPKRFDLYIEDLDPKENEAIIKIDKAAICKADLRYYLGSRKKDVLDLKYPMNLIHEAIGTIIQDKTSAFKIGEKVVLVPNIELQSCDKRECKVNVCNLQHLGSSYCKYSQFASSNVNGFAREFVSFPVNNILSLDRLEFGSDLVFCELVSVANCAFRRARLKGNEKIAVWGNGILGYILYNFLNETHEGEILIIGNNKEKLKSFGCSNSYLIYEEALEDLNIDCVFECVGGEKAEGAINQIMQVVKPGGQVVLLGVSEVNIGINTRLILEKGLSIVGATRSNVNDFEKAIELFQNHSFRGKVTKLILDEMNINNIVDFTNAFETELANHSLGKHILNFNL